MIDLPSFSVLLVRLPSTLKAAVLKDAAARGLALNEWAALAFDAYLAKQSARPHGRRDK